MTAAKKTKLEAVEADEPQLELELDPAPDLVEVTFRDQVFTIPKEMDEWETETCLAWARSVETSRLADWVETSKRLLGAQQWDRLQALGSKRKDMTEFLTAMINAVNKDCIA